MISSLAHSQTRIAAHFSTWPGKSDRPTGSTLKSKIETESAKSRSTCNKYWHHLPVLNGPTLAGSAEATEVDIDQYKGQLMNIAAELLSIGDRQGGRIFLRWSNTLHELPSAEQPSRSLLKQVAEVQTNARALVTLAIERHLGSVALGSPKQATLELAARNLVQHAALIKERLIAADAVVNDGGLLQIVGQSLTAVTFQRDCIVFQFGQSTLTAITLPKVREQKILYTEYDLGFHNALCRRIGENVVSVQVKEKLKIVMHFCDKCSIQISLRPMDRDGLESATFSSPSGCMWIW